MNKTFLFAVVGLFLINFAVASAEISRTLRLGSRGIDVRELQVFLNKDKDTQIAASGIGSPNNETSYFGRLTEMAVRRLQIKYAIEVLTPAGLSSPTGIVGPLTRALIYRLSHSWDVPSNNPVTISTPPVILSFSPSLVTKNPQLITIRGENFTEYNNTVVISSEQENGITGLSSPDGKNISFPFNFSAANKIKEQLAQFRGTSQYENIKSEFIKNIDGNQVSVIIVVKNANGESAPKTLYVDLKELI